MADEDKSKAYTRKESADFYNLIKIEVEFDYEMT